LDKYVPYVFSVAIQTALLLMASPLQSDAGAQTVQLNGRIDAFSYVSSREDARTTSTVLVPIPGMRANVRVTGGRVLITFCGKVSPVDIVLVEARVDGVAAAPGEVVLDAEAATETPVFEMHCFNWATSATLGPGWHTVEMMYRSLEGGEIVIQERSLSVLLRFTRH
jgi:hypothetical protein